MSSIVLLGILIGIALVWGLVEGLVKAWRADPDPLSWEDVKAAARVLRKRLSR